MGKQKNNWISFFIFAVIGLVFIVLLPLVLILLKVKYWCHVIKIQEWESFAILYGIAFFTALIIHHIYMMKNRTKKIKVKEKVEYQTYEESSVKTNEESYVSTVAGNSYSRGYLIEKTKSQLKDRIYIGNNEFYIGRDAGMNLVLNMSGVSKKHVRISKQNDKYNIMNTASTNGTKVNNIQLVALNEHLLQSGDLIVIASQEYYFYLEN